MINNKDLTIKVTYSDLMSRKIFYPENDFANLLISLTRRKSFTPYDLDLLEKFGFKVEIGVRENKLPPEYVR